MGTISSSLVYKDCCRVARFVDDVNGLTPCGRAVPLDGSTIRGVATYSYLVGGYGGG